MNSIICLSVQFCDNSLLVLKTRFHVFSFAREKVQGFSSDRKILILLSMLFHLQNRVSIFGNLIFSQGIWGNVYYVPEINLISEGSLIKSFYLSNKISEKFTFPTSLKASNKRTHIPLFINLFVSLIELKMQRLINYWTNRCKF